MDAGTLTRGELREQLMKRLAAGQQKIGNEDDGWTSGYGISGSEGIALVKALDDVDLEKERDTWRRHYEALADRYLDLLAERCELSGRVRRQAATILQFYGFKHRVQDALEDSP